MNNNSILIDRYLQNEMSADEKLAFENELAADKNLQEEFSIQQQIIKAAENAGLKNEFSKAIKKNIFIKRLLHWGFIVGIIVAAFVFYAVKNKLFTAKRPGVKQEIAMGLPVPEQFDISTASDTIIETKDGVVFAIPAHAFNSSSEIITLEIKTALNPIDIIKNGLSTVSNGNLLQTAGMFSINGFDKGQLLTMNKEIAVSIPAAEIDPDMQLFDAADSNGVINWVNPRPVEKRLRTYDVGQLDFYPPNYIPVLKALGKDYTNKKYTDSLYYSFSGYPHSNPLPQTQPASGNQNEYPLADSINLKQVENNQADYYIKEIDPAKIKTIWDKSFNNTLIATKEFEERLQYMHSICTGEMIAIYIANLDKPMYKTDQFIGGKTNGLVKEKFLTFAARKDGAVIVAAGIQKKLSNYFYQKSKAYREAVQKTWAKYQDSLRALNNIADTKRRAAALSNFKRENENFREELCTNLTAAYQQIGIKKDCRDTLPQPADKYYNVTISTPGWKNLDVYVFEATQNRQSMVYKDPVTGKTATLTYKEMNITIENRSQYDRVLVYLIPDSLSSFQRVQEQANVFKENLNSILKYDAVVVAYKGDQAFFFRQQLIQPANYVFSLSAVSTKEIDAILKEYSSKKSADIIADFEYQLFDQKEIKRQMELMKDREFREKIAAAIYNCGEVSDAPRPAAVMAVEFKK